MNKNEKENDMCNYLRPGRDKSQLEIDFDARFHRPEPLNYKKHFENGFEHPRIPVICDKAPDKILMGRWGLIPPWATNFDHETFYKEKSHNLLARIEDIDERVSFRDSAQNRCIILVESFKEWKHVPSGIKKVYKVPYEISKPDGSLMAIAGIYSVVNGRLTFAQVTTEANTLMAEIHNSGLRMPVILNKLEEKTWLGGADRRQFYDRSKIALAAVPENESPMQAAMI